MKRVVILGSTGSIGRQTLDVIGAHPDRFEVVGLGAGRNVTLLAQQARRFRPGRVVVADRESADALHGALGNAASDLQIGNGLSALTVLAQLPEADIVVAGLVGAMGLAPTYAALACGKRVALANKETMVVAGELMRRCAASHGGEIVPVDSEHSAVYQSLKGNDRSDVTRVTLTASGGPFRDRPLDTFGTITPDEALAHPNWSMGEKVTIDSATMMNKGLEVIEARWLFDLPPERIGVVIHPQSIVHALVEYLDGAVLAQLAVPDMRAPIAYALAAPIRIASGISRLDLAATGTLTFASPDPARYPCLGLARAALDGGGSLPAVLNAANEVAVRGFLDGQIPFDRISAVVEAGLTAHKTCQVTDLETALAIDVAARRQAEAYMRNGRPS
ncbi:MAG: 1-deoxy-D-xylulose-5-phosphate reductoisomerase [Deltaproteobacteria bacterium]|nr:1-deoxy-D-xylulose-5-phosphate reductoisomerase [Deltaproteobacteria bacterium]